MKDTHLYERLSNYKALNVLINMIKTDEEHIAKEIFANITKDANDHPKYSLIKEVYVERFSNR